jgi:tRNA(fMet)-specific endonuclease VapC
VTYLLDTDTCIAFLRGRDPALKRHVAALTARDIIVAAPVRAELFYGAARSRDPMGTRQEVDAFLAPFASLPFDDRAADIYGRIRAELTAAGTPIGPNDLLIAAVALVASATLVTHNTGEFARIRGILLDDWLQP